MFNLKCKEKLGIVIGACVDRFLFGACCHFPSGEPIAADSAIAANGSIASKNDKIPAQGILPTASQLDASAVTDNTERLPTTVDAIPVPAQFDADFSASYIAQASSSLQPTSAHSLPPHSSTLSPSNHDSTLLPVPLESVQGGSTNHVFSVHGTLHHQPHINSGLLLPLEHTTLTYGSTNPTLTHDGSKNPSDPTLTQSGSTDASHPTFTYGWSKKPIDTTLTYGSKEPIDTTLTYGSKEPIDPILTQGSKDASDLTWTNAGPREPVDPWSKSPIVTTFTYGTRDPVETTLPYGGSRDPSEAFWKGTLKGSGSDNWKGPDRLSSYDGWKKPFRPTGITNFWSSAESTTEDSPRFSTFMYVDSPDGTLFETTPNPLQDMTPDDPTGIFRPSTALNSFHAESKTEPNHEPTFTGSPNHEATFTGRPLPSETPPSDELLTTSEPSANPTGDSGSEPLWSIVHQLVPYPPSKETPVPELPLNSDELYTVLSASEPAGFIMENRIQVIPPLEQRPLQWKISTETSVSETLKPTTHAPMRMPTSRPWASSTYQIHTFKYPTAPLDTTPFPGSGSLVTWHGAAEEPSSKSSTAAPQTSTAHTAQISINTAAPQKTTSVTTSSSRPNLNSNQDVPSTATFLLKTTKPVAEITKPTTTTSTTTTSTTTTTTTTTERPTTTTTTTTLPPKKRTTPAPPKLKVTSPPPAKKPDFVPQAGILQSEFDSNIDDFVNQVVQNLAGSLDNLDLDEVILHSPLPATSPSSAANLQDDHNQPPTLHPLHVLSDPLFPPFPVINQVPLVKPPKKIPTTTSRPLDFRRDCGVRTMSKQGRIVGGSPSKFGKWPWQALVREATWLGLFSKNKCGGVLISPKYVLTAAHCQPGFLATLTVVLGDFDISSETEGAGGTNSKNSNSVTKNVRRVIVHRDYNAQTFENDIALLELESPVEYQAHIVPICLPMDNEVHVGQQAFVTGWGRLKYGGGVPNQLYEVDVPILNNSDCQNMFLKSGHIKAIRDSFICAGYANGAKDSCEGDSGGPLAMIRPNGQWMLAGTVSHGIKCAYPNLPGVYMRMTYYKPWIKRVTGITTVD